MASKFLLKSFRKSLLVLFMFACAGLMLVALSRLALAQQSGPPPLIDRENRGPFNNQPYLANCPLAHRQNAESKFRRPKIRATT